MRYPTRLGLAVPIEEVGYEHVIHQRKVTNRHHLAFYKADYTRSPLSRVFRGLSNRVVDMRMVDHNDLHRRFEPPIFPTPVQMIDCIEEHLALYGVIQCVQEKQTHEVYEVSLANWQYIKDIK